MIRCYALDEMPKLATPIALTIGNFDGVHLGHQKLLRYLKSQGTAVAITFANHPSTLFTPQHPTPLLCSLEERLDKMEICGIDYALILPFDQELSELSYLAFIKKIQEHIPFTKLVLGEGASFGKNREGTQENLQKLGLDVEYISKTKIDKTTISSGQIRRWLNEGKQELADQALGQLAKPQSLLETLKSI